jgi:hypothetical protein
MRMPVMNIRPMRMIVGNHFVGVFMTMRFTKGLGVAMIVIRISVGVDMGVRDLLVPMLV